MSAVANSEKTIQELEAQITSLKDALSKLERENARLSDELTVLINRFFRKKSERLDPNQLRLFTGELQALTASVTAEASEEVEEEFRVRRRRNGRGHGRDPFPPHLARETIELDVPEAERKCPDCAGEMRAIGEDTVERGHMIPAKMIVKRYVRKKYACPKGHGVRTAALPPPLVDKCKYERSVFAHLAVSKYGDHLPLNRLAGIYKRHGFSLPKSTMWDMLQRVDEIAAQPILRQMRQELLEETHLQGDETPVTVRLEDRKGSRKAYIWVYGTGKKRVFDFTMTRERDGPNRFLKGWRKGTLQTDGYVGYDEAARLYDLLRAGCWSHARRHVKEALDTGSKPAVRLMRPIGRLFWIERAMKKRAKKLEFDDDAFHELRRDVRGRLSSRMLARIDGRVQELWTERSTLPKSLLGKALTYLDNQKGPLSRFVDDPALEIHNNDSERALRHVVTGRKNWLFFGSPSGGRVGANLFSLIATCKALEINPVTYLEDILNKVDTTPASEVARLTPWAWAEETDQPERTS